MKVDHVLSCQFHAWNSVWDRFSIPSRVIPLSHHFVEWLVKGKFTADPGVLTVGEYEDCDSAFTNAELVQENIPTPIPFPEVHEQIQKAIDDLGGAVLPKLNWSTPKDAVWMNWTGNLKCQESEQVVLLLKSSDCIMHDLTEPFSQCEDAIEQGASKLDQIEFYIVLRRWQHIEPSSEFRCFVSHDYLIGITQRNNDQYFPFLGKHVKKMQSTITEFFHSKIQGKFSSHSYVFDVYLKNPTKSPSVVLVDLNPFGRVTDPLLFVWEELFLIHLAIESKKGELDQHKSLTETDFRYISSPIHIQPSLSTSNAKPIDNVDVSSLDGLLDLIRLQRAQSPDRSDGEEV